MGLKVYTSRISQPSRAILIFCKVNGIEFQEVEVDLTKRQHLTPEFQEINPMQLVPAIVDEEFKLFESHAILRYLSCAFPGVADHWYPSDLKKRANIDSVLDWHHSNLRYGTVGIIRNTILAPALGVPTNPQAAAEGEKIVCASLEKLETFWLKDDGPFLFGNSELSIADLSLVCEIMQLEFLDEKDSSRILGPHKRVKQWMENTKHATSPHFEEIHEILFIVKEKLQKQRNSGSTEEIDSSSKSIP